MRHASFVSRHLLALQGVLGLLGSPVFPVGADGVEQDTVALIQVLSPDRLLVDGPDGERVVRVRGVHSDQSCLPDHQLAWARRVLPPGARVALDVPGSAEPQQVRFQWRGAWLDWGFVLLRTGHVLPGGAAGDGTRVPRDYAMAVRDARSEGRGMWGECMRGRAIRRSDAIPRDASGVPVAILDGIAMVESQHNGRPWPWTLNVAGQGYFFLSREAAWGAVRRLESQHFDQFDVGLMQVNWRYHRNRFRNSWEALDPGISRQVAADILLEQWRRTGSLAAAIANYHSARPAAGQAYLQRVALAVARIRKSSQGATR